MKKALPETDNLILNHSKLTHCLSNRYKDLFNSIEQGFCIIEAIFDKKGKVADYLFLEVNSAFNKQMRLKNAIGKRLTEVIPEYQENWLTLYDQIVQTGKSARFENLASRRNPGSWYDVFAFTIDNPEDHHMAVIFSDVSKQKRNEANSMFLSRATDTLSFCITPCEILKTSCSMLGEYMSLSICLFVQFDEKNKVPVILNEWHSEETKNSESEVPLLAECLSIRTYRELRKGKTILIDNAFTNSAADRNKQNIPLRSCILSPVIRENVLSYVLIAIADKPRKWREDEIDLVRECTTRIWLRLERIYSEEALKESNRKAYLNLMEIESLYNNLPVGLCVFDLDLRYVRINKKLAEINGYPVSAHVGKTVKELIPAFYDLSKSIVDNILRTGESQTGLDFTTELPPGSGKIRSFSEDWVPIKSNSREIIGISVAVKETTDQKKASEKLKNKQEQLKKAKLALERSRKKLTIALDNGQIGLWEWHIRTDVFTWDERMAKMLGLPDTLRGKISTFKNLILEEDLQYVVKSLKAALDTGKPYETIFRVKSEYNYFLSKGLVSRDKQGKPVTLTGICFDITDMKRGAEKILINLNEELMRSNNDLQQFAYVASHDLQEPLRMVSSFTQLLQLRYGDKLDSDAKDYIHFAVEGSKRMYELLNSLLAYSRVQTKGKDFGFINMNKVLDKVKDNLNIAIKEKGAIIHSTELAGIFGDENQIIQVMQNLIVNAIKFSSGIPEISISCEEKHDSYIFTVADKGIGIDPQYFDRIFKIFQRLHRHDQYGGTGIGLAICKRIVQRHGGSIWVESEPGSGTTFYFSIPNNSARQPAPSAHSVSQGFDS